MVTADKGLQKTSIYIYLYPDKGFRVLWSLHFLHRRAPGGEPGRSKTGPCSCQGQFSSVQGAGLAAGALLGRSWSVLGAFLAEQRSQDREHRPQERPKTDNINRKSSPRPRTETARAAKDHPRGCRSHSRPRNKHIFNAAMFFTFFSTRPPT